MVDYEKGTQRIQCELLAQTQFLASTTLYASLTTGVFEAITLSSDRYRLVVVVADL